MVVLRPELSIIKRAKKDLKFRLRKEKVPMCIKIEKEEIIACDYTFCEYVFVDRCDEIYSTGELVYDYMGTSIKAYSLNGIDGTYFYYKVNQYAITGNKALTAITSRHFCNMYEGMYYDDPTSINQISYDRLPNNKKNKKILKTDLVNLPKSKVTSEHHIHFTAQEAYISVNKEIMLEREDVILRGYDGITSSALAGIILWATSLEKNIYNVLVNTGLFKSKNITEFIKTGKSVSIQAKSLQNIVYEDLRSIFESDVLVNRIDGSVDWVQEKLNRINPNVTNLDYEEVYLKSRNIFSEASLIGRKPTSMDWTKFWESRWQWSAAGSIHSQYPEDMSYVNKSRELKNKFVTITSMPELSAEAFLNRKSSLHAWSSTKYEWGKLRAIYGTDLTSYVIAHFAFYNCENVLPAQFPVGKDANDKNVSAMVGGVLTGNMPFCLDFEDFNSQHSISSMQAVIHAYADTFKNEISEEQHRAMMWTANSINDSTIHDNMGTGTTYKSNGTLLSGWRLTTFINSVLNYIYTTKLSAETMVIGNSLHNGDDVLLGVKNMVITQQCLKNSIKYNIRMQSSKCAFGAIAEFLRVDHVRGSKGQYLSRAMATLVHSRIESKITVDARDLIQSMENRFNDSYARGLSLSTIVMLRKLYYKRQSIICGMSELDMKSIKNAHRVVGGISTENDARIDVFISVGNSETKGLQLPDMPGIRSFARAIKNELKLEIKIGKIIDRVEKATYEAVLEKNRKVEVLYNFKDEWYNVMKALYKAHKNGVAIASYGKAALTGLTIELLSRDQTHSTLTRFLNSSQRPMEALSLVV